MIEVITHGYRRFVTGCPNCQCQFYYELEDVKNGTVTCPDCGYNCNHYSQNICSTSQIKDLRQEDK